MNTRQRELIRFALSYLMANRLDAFEDAAFWHTDTGEYDHIPTLEELDEIYAEFINPLPPTQNQAKSCDKQQG